MSYDSSLNFIINTAGYCDVIYKLLYKIKIIQNNLREDANSFIINKGDINCKFSIIIDELMNYI